MKARTAIAAVLAAMMTMAGVGCTPPSSDWEAEQRSHNFWNSVGFLIIFGLCQNTDFCPLPGGPTPPPPPAPE